MIVVVAIAGLYIKTQAVPAPLRLPTAAARAPAGPADGTWHAGTGSVAGFRVKETFIGFSNDVAGRTSAVTGTVSLSGGQVTAAAFRINLTTVTVNGKAQPQFSKSLGTQRHPYASFTLTQPATLGPAFATGGITAVTATGQLSMNGRSHQVTVTLSGRRDGAALEIAGSIPVTFAEWGIQSPAGAGWFGSLADHGVAEFLLTLHR